MKETRSKERRRQIINDPRLQFRFAGIIVGLSLGVSLILGGLVYQVTITTNKVVEKYADEGLLKLVRINLDTLKFGAFVIFVYGIGVALVTIIMTHRIAGPLKRIGHRMQRMAEGDFGGIINIRKRDELQEFARIAEYLRDRMRSSHDNTAALLDRLSKLLEELDGDLAAGLSALPLLHEKVGRCKNMVDAFREEQDRIATITGTPQ